MSDLSEQLAAILSNPEAQKNIQAVLSSFGGGNAGSGAPPKDAFPGNFFGGGDNSGPNKNAFPANLFGGGDGSGLNMDTLIKIQKVLSAMNQDDKDISLLRALRPHLKEPGRVDEAIRILQLISVLPALGESGLFGGGWH